MRTPCAASPRQRASSGPRAACTSTTPQRIGGTNPNDHQNHHRTCSRRVLYVRLSVPLLRPFHAGGTGGEQMTTTTQDQDQCRAEFEARFPRPPGIFWNGAMYCVREGQGYTPAAERYIGQWWGWQAAWNRRAAPAPAPAQPTSAEIRELYFSETGFDANDSPAAVFDFARALLAKFGGAAQPSNWQPIETAPVDGQKLLLGYHNKLNNWRTTRGQWMDQAYIDKYAEDPDLMTPGWYETPVEDDDGKCWLIDPTHWMPLPPSPKEQP